MTRPVCITGMHRSGTSMVARVAHELGVWLGTADQLVAPAPDNPEGFFENARLVAASDTLFEHLGAGWDCPPSFHGEWGSLAGVGAARDIARPVLDELRAHGVWGWKDPRVAPALPFWLDLVPDAAVVLCVRNPLEVAASLRARNGTSLALGVRLWAQYMRAAMDAVPAGARLVTHYDAWFTQPQTEVGRLAFFAEIDVDPALYEAATRVPARHARHAKFDMHALHMSGADASVRALYEQLCAEAGWSDAAAQPSAQPLPTLAPPIAPAPDVAVGQIDRAVVDVGLARFEAHKRNGRVAQLERKLAEAEVAAPVDSAPHDVVRATGALESLRATVYDLQLTVAELAARLTTAGDAEAQRDVTYARMIRSTRAAVRDSVPADARLLVFSEHDPALLDLHGVDAQHFPSGTARGTYGHRPPHGTAALAHLVAHRALGATHVLIPPTAAWWLDRYPDLADHLSRWASVVVRTDDGATIHRLGSAAGDVRTFPTAGEAIAAVRRRIGAEPSVLDVTSIGLTDVGGATTFRPLDTSSHDVPHVDSSVDVVVVDASADSQLAGEARRVGTHAFVTGAATSWSVEWLGEPPTVAADLFLVATAVRDVEAYAAVLSASLPAGHAGRTVVVSVPAEQQRWQGALAGCEVLAAEPLDDLVGRVVAGAATGTSPYVVILDGSAAPLEGWLPALLEPLRSDRVGLSAAKRRAFDSMTVLGYQVMDGATLVARSAMEGDALTRRVELAVPGAVAARRDDLAALELAGGFLTMPYAVAALSRAMSHTGRDVVVPAEAEVVDLGVAAPDAAQVAHDRAQYLDAGPLVAR